MSNIELPEEVAPAGLGELILWVVGRRKRVRINGYSMAPLLQDGDIALVDLNAYQRKKPAPGHIVYARHPYQRNMNMVKRVKAVKDDGRFQLIGDNPSESTDSRAFGDIPLNHILGRVTSIFSKA